MPNVISQDLLDQLEALAAEVVTEENLPELMKDGFEQLDAVQTPGGTQKGTGTTAGLTVTIPANVMADSVVIITPLVAAQMFVSATTVGEPGDFTVTTDVDGDFYWFIA